MSGFSGTLGSINNLGNLAGSEIVRTFNVLSDTIEIDGREYKFPLDLTSLRNIQFDNLLTGDILWYDGSTWVNKPFDIGDVHISKGNRITNLSRPETGSDYTLTFPDSLPSSDLLLSVNSSGNLSWNNNLLLSSDSIGISTGGIIPSSREFLFGSTDNSIQVFRSAAKGTTIGSIDIPFSDLFTEGSINYQGTKWNLHTAGTDRTFASLETSQTFSALNTFSNGLKVSGLSNRAICTDIDNKLISFGQYDTNSMFLGGSNISVSGTNSTNYNLHIGRSYHSDYTIDINRMKNTTSIGYNSLRYAITRPTGNVDESLLVGNNLAQFIMNVTGSVFLGNNLARGSLIQFDGSRVSSSVLIGHNVLDNTSTVTSADNIVVVGYNAFGYANDITDSIAIGYKAGYGEPIVGSVSVETGFSNVFLGSYAGANSAISKGRISIGNRTINNTDNSAIIGDSSITNLRLGSVDATLGTKDQPIGGLYLKNLSGTKIPIVNSDKKLVDSPFTLLTKATTGSLVFGERAGPSGDLPINVTLIGVDVGTHITSTSNMYLTALGGHAGKYGDDIANSTLIGFAAAGGVNSTGNTVVGTHAFRYTNILNSVKPVDFITRIGADNNTVVGCEAMNLQDIMLTGVGVAPTENIAMGFRAGQRHNGSYGVYIGTGSMSTSHASGSTGNYNVAVGYNDRAQMTHVRTGVNNVGIGAYTLEKMTSASDNVFAGFKASQLVTTATNSIAIGSLSSVSANAINQIAIGASASNNIDNSAIIGNSSITNLRLGSVDATLGTKDQPIGGLYLKNSADAKLLVSDSDGKLVNSDVILRSLSTGSLAFGIEAGPSGTLPSCATLIGYQAGKHMTNTSCRSNTVVGMHAGFLLNSTTATIVGHAAAAGINADGNTVIGVSALRHTSIFTGPEGSFVTITGATNNTAVGREALFMINLASVTGSAVPVENVAVGMQAGYRYNGKYNVFVGTGSMYTANAIGSTGEHNVLVGYGARDATINQIRSGSYNVGIGSRTLEKITTANNNVFAGYLAGTAVTTAVKSIAIGSTSTVSINADNQIAIGYGSVASINNTMVLGNSSITDILPGAKGSSKLGSRSTGFGELNIHPSDTGLGSIRASYDSSNAELYIHASNNQIAQIVFGTDAISNANSKWLLSSRATGGNNDFDIYRGQKLTGTTNQKVVNINGANAKTTFEIDDDAISVSNAAVMFKGGIGVAKSIHAKNVNTTNLFVNGTPYVPVDSSNFVTTNTAQTITGIKTFNNTMNVATVVANSIYVGVNKLDYRISGTSISALEPFVITHGSGTARTLADFAVYVEKVGQVVIVSFESCTYTSLTGEPYEMTIRNFIPPTFRPQRKVYIPMALTVNNRWPTGGACFIDVTGDVTFCTHEPRQFFGGGGFNGFNSFSGMYWITT